MTVSIFGPICLRLSASEAQPYEVSSGKGRRVEQQEDLPDRICRVMGLKIKVKTSFSHDQVACCHPRNRPGKRGTVRSNTNRIGTMDQGTGEPHGTEPKRSEFHRVPTLGLVGDGRRERVESGGQRKREAGQPTTLYESIE